jgi:4-amino-4-deoxy-L-arabinose transferase-like glycosyltransferase
MVVSSFKVFGVSLASARIPSAIFGTLSIGLIFLLGRKLFDSRVGLFSSFILPTIYLHFQISRWSTTDMALSFFILLALYFFVLLHKTKFQKNTCAYLFYISMGLGFMVKGPPAILIPSLTILGFLIATKKRSWFADLHIVKGLIILSIIILPWFIAMFWIHGEEFTNHIIGNEIKNRLAHNTPFSFYYIGVLFRYQLPWSLFFLFAVLKQFGFLGPIKSKDIGFIERMKELVKKFTKHAKLLFKEGNESLAFCYTWIVVCLVLFILLRVEHSRYMLPCFPAVSILTAKMFAEAEEVSLKSRFAGLNFSIIFTVLTFLALSILTGLGIFIQGSSPSAVFILPATLLVGALTLIWLVRLKSLEKVVFLMALVLTLTFSSLSGDGLPFVNRYPMKKFAEHINQENIREPIAIYKLGNHRARLGVLTGRTVITLHSLQEAEKFLRTNQKKYLVIKKTDWENEFSNPEMEIIKTDQIRIKTRIESNEIKSLLDIEKLRKIINSKETIYFMSNN